MELAAGEYNKMAALRSSQNGVDIRLRRGRKTIEIAGEAAN
jgi:hypothetical protein